MIRSWRHGACVCLAVTLMGAASLTAAPFTASYTDGASWNTLYGQGFNAFVNDGMTEPLEFGDPVPLSRFEFFKSGTPDEASNIQLAIIEPFYANLEGLTTSSAAFVGVSTNTISNTAGIATGAAIRFDFADLPLVFGNYYGAIFVNIDELGNVTPVQVSALHADFVQVDPPEGDPIFVPETNYDFNNIGSPDAYLDPGLQIDYSTSTTNFISDPNEFGTYFFGFSYGADANFIAYFDYEFPPGTPGDFDDDGDVDGRDFLVWQRGGSPTALSATDLADWQANYGTSAPAALALVPEPAGLLLLAPALLFFAKRR